MSSKYYAPTTTPMTPPPVDKTITVQVARIVNLEHIRRFSVAYSFILDYYEIEYKLMEVTKPTVRYSVVMPHLKKEQYDTILRNPDIYMAYDIKALYSIFNYLDLNLWQKGITAGMMSLLNDLYRKYKNKEWFENARK